MKRKETVREFINNRSYGAYIAFEFNTDKITGSYFKQYRCISVDDFLAEYGRRSSYILDDYIVVSTEESLPSNDQGQTIWMTLQKKSEYVETLKPIELTPFEVEDIINRLEKVKSQLDENYDRSAIEEIEYIIAKLEEK